MVQNPGKNSLDFSFDQFSSIARYHHPSMRFAIDCYFLLSKGTPSVHFCDQPGRSGFAFNPILPSIQLY